MYIQKKFKFFVISLWLDHWWHRSLTRFRLSNGRFDCAIKLFRWKIADIIIKIFCHMYHQDEVCRILRGNIFFPFFIDWSQWNELKIFFSSYFDRLRIKFLNFNIFIIILRLLLFFLFKIFLEVPKMGEWSTFFDLDLILSVKIF